MPMIRKSEKLKKLKMLELWPRRKKWKQEPQNKPLLKLKLDKLKRKNFVFFKKNLIKKDRKQKMQLC